MSRGAALTGALLATLETPATWPLALATFLVRGGLIVVLVPIVVLPTPVGFGNVFAPALASIAFGTVSTGLVVVSLVAALAVVGWIVFGGWLAAALEAEAARLIAAAADARRRVAPAGAPDSMEPTRPASVTRPARSAGMPRVAARILLARLIAFIPLAVALAFGTVRIVLVTYRELTSPIDTTTPIVLRVLRDTPEVIVAVVIAWTIGELLGAIAARRITLAGDGVVPALSGAVVSTVRHPVVTLIRFWLPTLVLLAILVPCAVAAGAAWSAVDTVLDGSADLPVIAGAVVLFVVLWLVELVVIAVASAWRAAVWTVAEVAREGTFGGSENRRTGDWRTEGSSATL